MLWASASQTRSACVPSGRATSWQYSPDLSQGGAWAEAAFGLATNLATNLSEVGTTQSKRNRMGMRDRRWTPLPSAIS